MDRRVSLTDTVKVMMIFINKNEQGEREDQKLRFNCGKKKIQRRFVVGEPK